jgi:acyl-coenzyme A thioesterase 9
MTPHLTSVLRRLKLSTDAKLRRRFMVIDEPVKANIRVGLLLELLDKLAEDTALRYARKTYPNVRVVTAAMDDLEVWNPPDINKDIILKARINLVGRSSREVGIRLEHPGPIPIHLGTCYFTMVARLNENCEERSVPLPALEYSSPTGKERASRALERREKRRREKKEELPTAAEYAMLHALHQGADQPTDHAAAPLLIPRDLVTSGWERTYPEHENVPQKIFGGYVAHRAYMYGHICAEMVADHRALLISSDRIDFYQPVRMGDKLHFVSRVTYTGHTSITVETAITRISRDRSMTALSNNCIFTFVNVDAELNLLPVPRMYPTTYSEDILYLAGYRRHQASQRIEKGSTQTAYPTPALAQTPDHPHASPRPS